MTGVSWSPDGRCLLAGQHGITFRERFANYPVRVEVLSRFLTAKEQSAVVRDLESGAVDIVIGVTVHL